jgi:hypothetical protein
VIGLQSNKVSTPPPIQTVENGYLRKGGQKVRGSSSGSGGEERKVSQKRLSFSQ